MKTTVMALLASLMMGSAAQAQVVYTGVQYQYGAHRNVYYGGTQPGFGPVQGTYLPPGLQAGGRVPATPGLASANGTTTVMPDDAMEREKIFSDAVPYENAGLHGYTPDDARNEAYANAPRVVEGARRARGEAGPVVEAAPAPPVRVVATDPRIKAIPLLDWAKVERTRNPALYDALMDEARKYDAVATTNAERQFASEK